MTGPRSTAPSTHSSPSGASSTSSADKGTFMKALVKAQRAPGIWMEEIPEPKVGHNDVMIKVRKTAICGTDMHIYLWDQWAQRTIPVPMAVGHEYVGEIVAIGSEVQGFEIGDR